MRENMPLCTLWFLLVMDTFRCGSLASMISALDELIRVYLKGETDRQSVSGYLSTLRMMSSHCHSAAEFGVSRDSKSTFALLLGLQESPNTHRHGSSLPKLLFSFGWEQPSQAGYLQHLSKSLHIEYSFTPMTDFRYHLDVDVDLLFLDGVDTYANLRILLRRLAHRTNKYIVVHGTNLYGIESECHRHRHDNSVLSCEEIGLSIGAALVDVQTGLWSAIEEFLSLNHEWHLLRHYGHSNGLTVLVHRPKSYISQLPCNLTSIQLRGRAADFQRMWVPDPSSIEHETQRKFHGSSSWGQAQQASLYLVLGNPNFSSRKDDHMKRALRLNPVQPHAVLLHVSNLCPLWVYGKCCQDADGHCFRERDEAVSMLKAVVEAYERLWEAHLVLGTLLAMGEEMDVAKEALMKALQLAPDSRQCSAIVGETLMRMGFNAEAEMVFQAAVANGVWHHAGQRSLDIFWPSVVSPGPFPTGDDLPKSLQVVKATVEKYFHAGLRQEIMLAVSRPFSTMRLFTQHATTEGISGKGVQTYGAARAEGTWEEVYIFSREAVFPKSSGLDKNGHMACLDNDFPILCRLLASFPLEFGLLRSALSIVYGPRTHIPTHHSRTQGRLRLHCPVLVPASSTSILHVGAHQHDFKEGECWWFDESFEHHSDYSEDESGGEAQGRVSLYIDVQHPDVPEDISDTIPGYPTAIIEPAPLSPAYFAQALCRGDIARWNARVLS